MVQFLHGSATTTAKTRAELQASEESVAALARVHGVNPKTFAKWRKRDDVEDLLPLGPRERRHFCEDGLEIALMPGSPAAPGGGGSTLGLRRTW